MAMLGLGMVLRLTGDLDGARSTLEAGLRMSRRNGDNLTLATACLGLACVTGDAGDWHRAATLHGIAQAVADRMGSPWQELNARHRQDSLAQARARLGDEQLQRAYAQAWHSASTRPSTWLSEDRVRPDRRCRLTPGWS